MVKISTHQIEAYDSVRFRGAPQGDSSHVSIETQMDGPVTSFGALFWKVVRGLRPQAFAPAGELVRVTYADRFLRNALSTRLLGEVLSAAPGKVASTRIELLTAALPGADRWSGRSIVDD